MEQIKTLTPEEQLYEAKVKAAKEDVEQAENELTREDLTADERALWTQRLATRKAELQRVIESQEDLEVAA